MLMMFALSHIFEVLINLGKSLGIILNEMQQTALTRRTWNQRDQQNTQNHTLKFYWFDHLVECIFIQNRMI